MTPLLAQLKEGENRKKQLVFELESLAKHVKFSDIDGAGMKRDLRRRIVDSKALLVRQKA